MQIRVQDLIKVEKPIVVRKGREVSVCNFYKLTGDCFGFRCFWIKYGNCPYCKISRAK